jgi:hypothetical protein
MYSCLLLAGDEFDDNTINFLSSQRTTHSIIYLEIESPLPSGNSVSFAIDT